MTKAIELFKGTWAAIWGNWRVDLVGKDTHWEVTVWRWLPKQPAPVSKLDSWDEFTSQSEAVTFACDVMRRDGATIMVLGAPKPISLESVLRFQPVALVA